LPLIVRIRSEICHYLWEMDSHK